MKLWHQMNEVERMEWARKLWKVQPKGMLQTAEKPAVKIGSRFWKYLHLSSLTNK